MENVIQLKRPADAKTQAEEMFDRERRAALAEWLRERANAVESGEVMAGVFLSMESDEEEDGYITRSFRLFDDRMHLLGLIEYAKYTLLED